MNLSHQASWTMAHQHEWFSTYFRAHWFQWNLYRIFLSASLSFATCHRTRILDFNKQIWYWLSQCSLGIQGWCDLDTEFWAWNEDHICEDFPIFLCACIKSTICIHREMRKGPPHCILTALLTGMSCWLRMLQSTLLIHASTMDKEPFNTKIWTR